MPKDEQNEDLINEELPSQAVDFGADAETPEEVETENKAAAKKRKITNKKISKPRKKAAAKVAPVVEEEFVPVQTLKPEPVVPATPAPNSPIKRAVKRDMTQSLEAIYHDDRDPMPNMQRLEIKKSSWFGRVLSTILMLGVLGGLATLAAWWYFSPNTGNVGDNVVISVTPPQNITLGATSTFEIAIANNETVSLRSAVLELYYPSGFIVTDTSEPPTNGGKNEWLLGTIPGREVRSVTISGRLFAPINAAGTFRALVSYQPEGFQSTFQKNSHVDAIVTQSPFGLSIVGPTNGVAGVLQTYTVKITRADNLSSSKALIVAPDFPSNFHLATSSIATQKDGRWNIVSGLFATSTNMASFSLSGIWDQDSEQENSLGAQLLLTPPGSTEALMVADTNVSTTLVKNSALLTLAINGSTANQTIQPGDALAVTVQLTNNNSATLHNGTVKLMFDAPAIKKQSIFDWANITDANNGNVTGEAIKTGTRRGTVVWTGKEIPALQKIAPGASVLIELKLPVRDTKSFDWSTVAPSSSLNVSGEGRFTDDNKKDVIVNSQPVSLTPRSDLALEVRDDAANTTNLIHHITWVVTNTLHPLKNLELSATMFGDVLLDPPTNTPAGVVSYDKKSKILTWTIPEMPIGLDVVALPFTLTIGTKNPTQTTLVSKVRFKAVDTVTGESLNLLGEEIPLTQ